MTLGGDGDTPSTPKHKDPDVQGTPQLGLTQVSPFLLGARPLRLVLGTSKTPMSSRG